MRRADRYGWRRGEFLDLEHRHVDLDAGTLRLDPHVALGPGLDQERRVARVVYLTPEASHLLREQLARVQKATGRIVPYVFPHLRGPYKGRRRSGLDKAWATACRKAGGAGRLVHDLRRTAVRNMERSGVPRSWATKMTGHQTESVYRRYAIVSDNDLREAARRLETGAFRGAFSHSGE